MTTITASTKEVLETVSLVRSLGINALPIGLNSKASGTKGYTDADYVTDWSIWTKQDLGIGIIFGGEHRLIDIDIDDPRITRVASQVLPDTSWCYGRQSKKSSHYVYSASTVAKTTQYDEFGGHFPLKTKGYSSFSDPQRSKEDPSWKPMIIEFRGDGAQSVLPGTLHEKTGELIQWENGRPTGLPPEVDATDLRRTVKKLAFLVVVSDYAWVSGMRHEVTLCLSGMMVGNKWEEQEALLFLSQVMDFTGEGERSNVLRAVSDTYKRFAAGDAISGGPKMCELLGDSRVVDVFRSWFSDRLSACYEDFDARFSALKYFGSFAVVEDPEVDDVNEPDFEPMKLGDFQALYMNEFLMLQDPGSKDPNKKQRVPKTKIWLDNPRRVTYNKVHFRPGAPKVDGKSYNLWRGWAVDPDAGKSCALWLRHVREFICGGNEDLYSWVLDWCADLVQDPLSKPGTSIVMCSSEGTGKNTFVNGLWKMLGLRYYREMSHAEQLTSRFNDQLTYAMLVFANEATFAKDPRHHPILKALVSEEIFQAEAKHRGAKTGRNYARLIMASNKDHVIERSTTDRRFTVVDVKNPETVMERGAIEAYFSALNAEINGDGPAGLMSFLLDRKYRKWDIRKPFITDAARRQTLLSMPGPVQFWMACLNDGSLGIREDDQDGLPVFGSTEGWHEEGWPIWVSKTAVENAFLHSKHAARTGGAQFWVEFYKQTGVPRVTRKRIMRGGRKNTMILPPLNECIDLMNQRYPGSIDVPEEAQEDTVEASEF